MDKNVVGDWGANLSDRDYGRALAALGVLEATGTQQHGASADPEAILAALREEFNDGDRTALWRGAYKDSIALETPKSWQETVHQNAQALAEAWRLLVDRADHPRKRPRLAVAAGWRRPDHLFDLEALMGWLGANDTDCQAVVLAPEAVRPGECRTVWHWPLHVGVPAGANGRQLWEALQKKASNDSSRLRELGLLRLVGEARDACDLLILPSGMAAELAEQTRLRLQASFIVCLDEPVPWNSAPDTPQARLRGKLGAAGVALVGAAVDPAEAFYWLLRELSHDLPVHAALWGAGRFRLSCRPMILGEPESLDRLRILAVAEHLDRKQELLRQSVKAKPTRSKGQLSTTVRNRQFASEKADGMPTAEDMAAAQEVLEAERRLRHIQAYVWREDAAGPEPAMGLAPERLSLLTVHIGPDKKPRPDPPFPEGQIDFSSGPVGVTVQLEVAGAAVTALGKNMREREEMRFFEAGKGAFPTGLFQMLDKLSAAPEPRAGSQIAVGLASSEIILPEAGDSTRALFAVWPQAAAQEVQGRIAIIYQNRIVQTAGLQAPVTTRGEEGTGVMVVAEATVHPRLDDLAERRQFDLALMTADDLGSRLRLTVSCDGTSREVMVDNLEEAVKNIKATVFETVRRSGDILALNSEEMQIILCSLASHGRLLYDELHKGLGERIDVSERLQLVCRGKAFFPLEYVYDGAPPNEDAKVCLEAAKALDRRDCGACPHQGAKEFIGPLGFWGLRKVIERHGEVPKDKCIGSVGVDRLNLPSPTRNPFGPLQPVLFAASNKAFKFADGSDWRNKLLKSLGSLGGGTAVVEATTWDDWRNKVVSTPPPKILVRIPHTDQILIRVDALEIADKKWLKKDQVLDDVVGPKEAVQLLLLLGCGAAQVTGSFAPFPLKFHDAGADIVIAPLEAILGADAVPIGTRIADLLADHLSSGQEVTFGELLRDLRRGLLAEGHPGVLGLVGFGDADWVFGG